MGLTFDGNICLNIQGQARLELKGGLDGGAISFSRSFLIDEAEERTINEWRQEIADAAKMKCECVKDEMGECASCMARAESRMNVLIAMADWMNGRAEIRFSFPMPIANVFMFQLIMLNPNRADSDGRIMTEPLQVLPPNLGNIAIHGIT